MNPTGPTLSHYLRTSWRSPLLPAIAYLVMHYSVYGQGLVSGVVVDGPSRTPIEGVTVVLAGTLFGTVTGPDGTFSLGPVSDGEYKLRVIRAGYEPVEIAAVVPGSRIVLQLGKERPDLPADAHGVFAAPFRKGEFPARGDPILGAISSAPTRVPGVTARHYGLAFLDPMVRGFAEGRSRLTYGDFLTATHEVPGVGRIDLHSRDGAGGAAYYGGVPLTGLPVQSLLWWPTNESDPPIGGTAVVEGGYQTNLDAFHTSGDYLGRIDGTRYRLIASHAQSSDYKGASGESVEASYKRSSGRITVDHQFAKGGSVRFAGEVSEARSVSIPGAQGALDFGRLLGASAAFQISPERNLLRRLSGNLSISQSEVTIDQFASDAVLGDAMTRSVGAVLAVDLFHPRLETAQAGIRLGHVGLEGKIQSPGSNSLSFFWPDVSVFSSEAFVTASLRSLTTRAAITGRAGFARFKPDSSLSGGSASLPERTDLVGSLAATMRYRRDQNLSLSIGLYVIRRAPSPLQRYSAPHLPVDGVRTIVVAGDPALDPEWTYTFDSGFTARIRKVRLELRPFVSVVRDFIGPGPADGDVAPGGETWVYRNGAATFWGYELSASYSPIPFVSVSGHLDYTRATDLELNEAIPGIPPFSGRLDVTASSPDERLLLEVSSEFSLKTGRVAVQRGELAGGGHLLFHWWLGLPLRANVILRVGVFNLFNTSFEPQPGLFNRENDMRIPGPGRSWLFSLRVTA